MSREPGELRRSAQKLPQLTERQRLWAHYYAASGNALQSVIDVGYSARSARSQSDRMVKNPEAMALVAQLHAQRAQRVTVTAEMVIARAWEIAQQERPDRVQALALLAKLYPEFRERVDMDLRAAVTVQRATPLLDARVVNAESREPV